jgi:phage pi2 protein 07
MVTYCKSKEGEAAYAKIGKQYPTTVFDQVYDNFLKKTAKSPVKENKTIIHRVIRLQTAFTAPADADIADPEAKEEGTLKEFLIYDQQDVRKDPLGNELREYRTNLGRYPIPIPQFRLRKDENGYEEKYVHSLSDVRTGYSLLFTKKNVQDLHRKGCLDRTSGVAVTPMNSNGFTHYMVQKEGERNKTMVRSYDEFVNGDFEELYRYGRIRTEAERSYEELSKYGRNLTEEERQAERNNGYINTPIMIDNNNPEDRAEALRMLRGGSGPHYG